MHRHRLLGRIPHPDVAAPRLEIGEIADRGGLKPPPDPGAVNLEVVDARRGEGQVARGEVDDAIGQPKASQARRVFAAGPAKEWMDCTFPLRILRFYARACQFFQV